MTQKRMLSFFNSNLFSAILATIAFCLMTFFAVVFEQSILRLLPFYMSLFVRILHSRANRFGHLIGGLNAILYGMVYLYYRLYGSMLYAFFISCPIQLITFFVWSRRSYKKTTVFRSLSNRSRLLILGAVITAYIVYVWYMLNNAENANFIYIDSVIFILGLFSPVLTLCAFYEYTYFQLASQIFSIILYVLMTLQSPEVSCYVVFSVYALICIARQTINVVLLRKEQVLQKGDV